MATNQEIAEEKKQQLYGLLTEKHSARRNEAAKLHASTISVLQHLTHARHMCYKRMFVLENCLRWQKPKMMVDPKTCAKAKTLFQACNAELLRKLKADCPNKLKALTDCLDKNHQDASKCSAAMLDFDRCTEDYMPGQDFF